MIHNEFPSNNFINLQSITLSIKQIRRDVAKLEACVSADYVASASLQAGVLQWCCGGKM